MEMYARQQHQTRFGMNKLLRILFIAIAIIDFTQISAQDVQLQAVTLFNKAVQSYEIGHFQEAITHLREAEAVLGETNSKILYLKINSLKHLADSSHMFYKQLNEGIDNFFLITDAKTYPQEKYMDIIGIQLDWKTKSQNELKEYSLLNDKSSITEYSSFLTKYPWSPHRSIVEQKMNIHVIEKQRLQKTSDSLARVEILIAETKKGRSFLQLSPGSFSPFGLALGFYNNRLGAYIAGRTSKNSINSLNREGNSVFDVDEGGLSYYGDYDGLREQGWYYTGNGHYHCATIASGLIVNFANHTDKITFLGYGGLGYGSSYFVYEYTSNGDDLAYAKYTPKHSKSHLVAECGVMLNLYHFQIAFGYSGIFGSEDYNLVAGLGWVL
jgi:hypothetical protein